ncbi:MAG: PIN domain-containing protein [Alphaproteobacteria bacterium]|nr:PIN domain-containing protein [Alphaproteobacteria bacterium]
MGEGLSSDVLAAVDVAGRSGRLFVSVVTPIEVALAAQKKNASRINLDGLGPIGWCSIGVRNLGARWASIGQRVALSASETPRRLGYRDPCDALIVATAHARRLRLVTSDERILALAKRDPVYLDALRC